MLLTFLAGLDSRDRTYLRHIEIHQYIKKDAKTALTFLAEARGLEHLRIEVGIANDDNVEKTASSFWSDACKLLEVVGSRIEKTMVRPRKAKVQEVQEESSEDESDEEDEDDEEEEAESDEDEEADTEEVNKPAKPTQSDQAEAQDTKNDSADSSGPEDTIQVKTEIKPEVANAGEDMQAATKAKGAEESTLTNGIENATETEEKILSCETEKAAENSKKDSKSPIPSAPTKKVPTKPEPPKLIQGQKSFAVDILDLGRFALKNKGGASWTAAQKQKFLTLLEGKLK